jgi:protoporphyrinogen oxidase
MEDRALIDLASREMEKLGLLNRADVQDGCVVRQKKAYPVYDDQYKANVKKFVSEIESAFPGLHLIGRNGMHKYNNQDHAMMTAMLTARNLIAGKRLYDVWEVNQDAEYHESGGAGQQSAASGLRMVPTKLSGDEHAKGQDAAVATH